MSEDNSRRIFPTIASKKSFHFPLVDVEIAQLDMMEMVNHVLTLMSARIMWMVVIRNALIHQGRMSAPVTAVIL